MKTKTVFFEQALRQAILFVKQHQTTLGTPVLLIRDLFGRIRIAIRTAPDKESERASHTHLAEAFSAQLQAYAPPADAVFLYGDELFAPDAIFDSPDKHQFEDSEIYVLDRQVTGLDWLRTPFTQSSVPPRVTLFGIKGGVGRSTALAVWAWNLAQRGKRVLILDLDLESPGISQMLLPTAQIPQFGIVDWFVEEARGQGEAVLSEMVGNSPLVTTGMGQIRVVPAAGALEGDYLAKLSRVYLDLNNGEKPLSFADRLAKLLAALEQQEQPDIVLLDSRAGLHDIAAITITRLNALALLFAVNTAQTWQAYRYLFTHWQRWGRSHLPKFRQNLKIVASMVPEVNGADYLHRFRQSAHDLFSDTLYEQVEPKPPEMEFRITEENGQKYIDVAASATEGTCSSASVTEGDYLSVSGSESFNFDENMSDAPHFPLKIYWNRAFLEFDPVNKPELFEPHLVQAVYGSFLEQATELALGEST